jgi:3-hydroxyisobutyrate dehydrogenase-like beta-hydroxyacid dehydrogenase
MSAPDKVGFVGLGMMGALMSARLLEHVGSLHVYDVREEAVKELVSKGATACASAAEVGAACDTVFVSLPMPAIVRGVVAELISGGSMKTFIDLSTTGPTVAAEVLELTNAAGVEYLDSPVSGGPGGARGGTLTMMSGGSQSTFDEIRPLLDVLGANVVRVGDRPGQGQLAKLINNLLSATAVAITSEAMCLGAKGGLDPAVLLEVINTGSGRNTATMDKFPRTVIPRTFDFGFRLELMTKDVDLCLAEADRNKIPMIVGSMVQRVYDVTNVEAGPGADLMELTRVVERWSGVTIGEESS